MVLTSWGAQWAQENALGRLTKVWSHPSLPPLPRLQTTLLRYLQTVHLDRFRREQSLSDSDLELLAEDPQLRSHEVVSLLCGWQVANTRPRWLSTKVRDLLCTHPALTADMWRAHVQDFVPACVWGYLPGLTVADVDAHPDLSWSWSALARRLPVTVADVLARPHWHWPLEALAQNPHLAVDDVLHLAEHWGIATCSLQVHELACGLKRHPQLQLEDLEKAITRQAPWNTAVGRAVFATWPDFTWLLTLTQNPWHPVWSLTTLQAWYLQWPGTFCWLASGLRMSWEAAQWLWHVDPSLRENLLSNEALDADRWWRLYAQPQSWVQPWHRTYDHALIRNPSMRVRHWFQHPHLHQGPMAPTPWSTAGLVKLGASPLTAARVVQRAWRWRCWRRVQGQRWCIFVTILTHHHIISRGVQRCIMYYLVT